MKVLRVFPKRTSMTPDDTMVFVGNPPLGLWRPTADEVHISCTFTWDIEEANRLHQAWSEYYDVVRIGGPAFSSPANGFAPGMYVKSGVTFTTRGCNNSCPWCLVPEREGRLREIEGFAPGYIVQDNNLLQASRYHLRKVFAMLKAQRRYAVFSGGLDARIIASGKGEWIVDQLKGIGISKVFLAADTKTALGPLVVAADRLSFLGLRSNKMRCYVMIGYDGETVEEAHRRLERVWQIGFVPFAQLYQPPDQYIEYPKVWKRLARTWSRPAAIRALH